MTERWVINATPLILLGKAGQLVWLPKLGEVVVPAAVALEITAGAKDEKRCSMTLLPAPVLVSLACAFAERSAWSCWQNDGDSLTHAALFEEVVISNTF